MNPETAPKPHWSVTWAAPGILLYASCLICGRQFFDLVDAKEHEKVCTRKEPK